MSTENVKNTAASNQGKGGGPMPGPGGPGGPGPGGRHGGMYAQGKPKEVRASIKRLFSYIEKDKYKMVLAFLCVILQSVTNLLGSYLLRPIINLYLTQDSSADDFVSRTLERMVSFLAGLFGIEEVGRIGGLFFALVLMFAVYLLTVLSAYGQSRIMIGISQRALQNIRNDLYGKM